MLPGPSLGEDYRNFGLDFPCSRYKSIQPPKRPVTSLAHAP
jgi:hypothetical protein